MTQSTGPIGPRRSPRAAAAAAWAALTALTWNASAAAQALEPAAVGNRAQTAYLRGDASGLTRLESSVRDWSKSKDSLQLYAYAFIQFRKLQLARDSRRDSDAEAAGKACIAATDAAVDASGRFADAYVLRAACQVYLGSYSMLSWYSYGSEADDGLELSRRIAPRNPRATFIEGLRLWFGPVFVGDQKEACKRMLEAVQGFGDAPDAAVMRDSVGIRWGAAEANYWMGRCSRESGDRESEYQYYDRALRFAPDFALVRRIVR